MIDWTDAAKIFIAILVIVNPLGTIPIFITLTENETPQARAHIARVTSIAMAVVLIMAAFVGDSVLAFFGIGIPSFKVGGGILLLLMSIAMMQAKQARSNHTPEEAREAEDKDSIAVVPLAIPLLSGPGAISTVIIYANASRTWLNMGAIAASCLLVGLVAWLALRLADPVSRMLGHTGINIVTRLMGLLLAALAVEFLTSGLGVLLPGLARG